MKKETINYKINEQFNIEMLESFYGPDNYNIKLLEKNFDANIVYNSYDLKIDTTNKDKIIECIKLMENKIIKGELNNQTMQDIINNVLQNEKEIDDNIKFVTTFQGKIIRPKNNSQFKYYNELKNNTITFATGVAGTGKTFLAVCYAINLLKLRKIEKIIITRPIVEAGENLGFLPGEIKEKVDPYLIPIYDALYTIIGKENTDKYIEKQIVEIAPLAYMRGRTLNNAFIILDEAQNTTQAQMKMFLTRLGYDSYMVITGDQSQIDLKPSIVSGIVEASKILKGIDGIGFIDFEAKDVVRHPLVAKIIKAYENNKQ